MKNKYHSLKKLALATLALGTLAQPVAADDTKTYAGTMCQPAGGSGNPAPQYGATGSISNPGPISMLVVCPIVRDNNRASIGLDGGGDGSLPNGIKEVFMSVDNRNRFYNLICTLSIRDFDGNTVRSATDSTETTSLHPHNSFLDIVNVSAVPPPNSPAYGSFHYSLFCTIPAPDQGVSRIIAYRVIEASDEDTKTHP